MNDPLRKQHLIVGVLVGTLFIGLLPSSVHAFTAGPAVRCGVATFPAGNDGITVTFPSLPNSLVQGGAATWTTCNAGESCPYVVVMGEASNAAGYSGTTDATWFNVLKKVQTQFQVQHKRSSDGLPLVLTGDVQLNWCIFKCAAGSSKACQ